MSTRRGFMASILAAGFAPAAVGSGVLMPVRKVLAAPQVWVLHAGRICYVDDTDRQIVRVGPVAASAADRLMVDDIIKMCASMARCMPPANVDWFKLATPKGRM